MANPSGMLNENSATVLTMKHNPGVSLDWSLEEEACLEEQFARYASESILIRYGKVMQQLQNKTVRDVALRVRWMNEKENCKRRRDDCNLTRKNKDKKLAAQTSVSLDAPTIVLMDNDDGISYKAIGGPTGELLEQNAQVLSQISANLAAFQLQDNIKLFSQTRDSIIELLHDMNDNMPKVMKGMPPLLIS